MASTPDRKPGPLEEDDEIRFVTNPIPPTQAGAFNYNGTGFQLRDSVGIYDPRNGITAGQHQAIRQLIHFIDDGPANGFPSGSYKETTPTGPFPTSEIWWESSGKLKKIVSLDTTWTGPKITQEVWKVYDVDGSLVLATVTDVISYSGVFETSRTRTIA